MVGAVGDGPQDWGDLVRTATRLRPPASKVDVLSRPRVAQLFEARSAPIVLVSAPAGFGKSTAVVEWPAERAGPAAWVSLDERDDDPWVFFALVAAAMRSIVGDRRLAGLASAAGDRSSTADRWASALLDDLDAIDERAVLVLDDLHHIGDPVVAGALDRVAQELPEHVRLVLSTDCGRSGPPTSPTTPRPRGSSSRPAAGSCPRRRSGPSPGGSKAGRWGYDSPGCRSPATTMSSPSSRPSPATIATSPTT